MHRVSRFSSYATRRKPSSRASHPLMRFQLAKVWLTNLLSFQKHALGLNLKLSVNGSVARKISELLIPKRESRNSVELRNNRLSTTEQSPLPIAGWEADSVQHFARVRTNNLHWGRDGRHNMNRVEWCRSMTAWHSETGHRASCILA